jgi:alkylation response protein AidB-like acyl-CoA dehydrogenase
MRATRSDDTVLDGAFVPDNHIVRVVAPGLAGADFFILSIFAWALMGFGNVYYGLAQRMLELAVEQVKSKGSLALTRSMAYHPEVQHGIAEMVMALEAIGAQLESVTQDWSNGVDHGHGWPTKLIAAKYNAVEGAWKIVDRALEVSGGFGMFKKSEMERLFRDARAGRFHPANSALAHELIGKMALGINPDETPRWG